MAHAHSSAPAGAPDHAQPRLDALFWAVGAVIALLTATAFWLSYEHLHTVAAGHGLGGAAARSWAWPACLDAFIVVGELLMLRAAWRRTGTDWWAVSLTVSGAGGSIALNVLGVGAHASALDYVVAGVPPTAALLAFGVFMRQLLLALTGTAQHTPTTAPAPTVPARPVPRPPVVPPGARLLPITARPVPADLASVLPLGPRQALPPLQAFVWQPGTGTTGTGLGQAVRAAPVPAAGSGTRGVRAAVPQDTAGTAFEEHVRTARALLAADPGTTGTAIAATLGTTPSYGRRVRRAALS